MLSFRAGLAFVLAAAVAVAPALATPTHKKSSTPHARTARSSARSTKASAKSRKGSKKSRRTKLRGQQVIDSARAMEIQQALIREHYLAGEPTGQWDKTHTRLPRPQEARLGSRLLQCHQCFRLQLRRSQTGWRTPSLTISRVRSCLWRKPLRSSPKQAGPETRAVCFSFALTFGPK